MLLSVVFQFSVAQVHVGSRKQFINNFVFTTWACAAGFNNNNNNNKNNNNNNNKSDAAKMTEPIIRINAIIFIEVYNTF